MQHDLIQTPLTSIAGIWPKQPLGQDYHDHHDKDWDRVQMRHEHDKYDVCRSILYNRIKNKNRCHNYLDSFRKKNKYNLESKTIR